jgi:hypothetical protein
LVLEDRRMRIPLEAQQGDGKVSFYLREEQPITNRLSH